MDLVLDPFCGWGTVAVVALMSVLTIYGKVSGDALLFLAGTATEYAFAFVQRFISARFRSYPSKNQTEGRPLVQRSLLSQVSLVYRLLREETTITSGHVR